MANTAGLLGSFKQDLLQAKHNFGTTVTRGGTGADTFYGALILTASSFSPTATTAYTGTVGATPMAGEAAQSGNYTAGGVAVTNGNAVGLTSTTAFWTPSASLSWTNLTTSGAVDTLFIFNNTTTGKPGVGLFSFGSTTVTAGNFSLTMPTNDSSTGLIRLA
jgi:hypothetical protein